MMCPADTPEGEACGLVKNLALLAHVTNDEDSDKLLGICLDLGNDLLRLSFTIADQLFIYVWNVWAIRC